MIEESFFQIVNDNKLKIAIMVFAAQGEALHDPEYCETHPTGGSETAATYMAAMLRQSGCQVDLLINPDQIAVNHYDVFISQRDWKLFAHGVAPGRLNYLWCQDDVDQQFLRELENRQTAQTVYERCDGVIMLSHYQAQRWISALHLPQEKIFMSTNGIPLERFQRDRRRLGSRPPHAYYASTPFRGLEQLLKAWPVIKKRVKDAHLHICSSMGIYNVPDSESVNAYGHLYELAKSLDGVTYHGSVGQARLRQISQQCRVLAYPCIFPETSCIVAMEAMASGAVVVASTLGALPETAWMNPMAQVVDNVFSLDNWIDEVCTHLEHDAAFLSVAQRNMDLASHFDWRTVAKRWLIRFHIDSSCNTRASPAVR